jgi:hypothetical protein
MRLASLAKIKEQGKSKKAGVKKPEPASTESIRMADKVKSNGDTERREATAQ